MCRVNGRVFFLCQLGNFFGRKSAFDVELRLKFLQPFSPLSLSTPLRSSFFAQNETIFRVLLAAVSINRFWLSSFPSARFQWFFILFLSLTLAQPPTLVLKWFIYTFFSAACSLATLLFFDFLKCLLLLSLSLCAERRRIIDRKICAGCFSYENHRKFSLLSTHSLFCSRFIGQQHKFSYGWILCIINELRFL